MSIFFFLGGGGQDAKPEHCDSNTINQSNMVSRNDNFNANVSLLKRHEHFNKHVVCTRVFYSSFVNKRNASSLLARGNKVRTMIKGHVKSNVKPQHMEIVRSRVIKSRVQPQVSHTCVSAKNSRTQDEIVPQVGTYDAGGSQQEVIPDSDTGMNSGSHMVETTGPSGHVVSSVSHMSPGNSIAVGPQNLALLYDVSVDWDEKYLNTVLPKSVADMHKNRSPCKLFQEWKDQSNFDFGFIPLFHFIMPKNSDYVAPAVTCPFELYHRVKSSGHLNYMACRIPVKSQLNVRAWEEMMEGYWDTQLTHRSCSLYSDHKNHSSALQHMSDVDVYLKEETHHGAILGPFDKNSIVGTHVSPFLTRDKSN